jgi:NAD+ kinase
MSARFRHAALVGKYQARGMRELLEDIAHFLERQQLEVSLETETALNTGITDYPVRTPDELGACCDLAVVVGGDGTMLGIARQLAPHNVPLVGINQGRLGFITDVPAGTFAESLAPMIAGDYEVEHRSMLEGGVWRAGISIFHAVAMNDVVVSRGSVAGMVELKIVVGPEFVANLRADGLIVASPTGSTAYSLSAGGPILLPDGAEIDIEVVGDREVSVNFDMQSLASLAQGDVIRVRRSAHQVRFLHPRGWSYYATLRRKLHWNEGAMGA